MAVTKKRSPRVNSAESVNEEELARRVAILRRFRELLLQQRERFQSYLAALDKQQTVIKSGNTDELLAHVELEEQIVADIFSIQKVIDPLESIYNASISSATAPVDDVPALKITLEDLRNQAAARAVRNRELLSVRMASIRSEITDLRNNPFANTSRSRYHHSGVASLVDIKG